MDVCTVRRHHVHVAAELNEDSAAERLVGFGGAARIVRPFQDIVSGHWKISKP